MTPHAGDLAPGSGRTFVVTGANSGIGFETANALVGRGAHVVLAVRDTAKGEAAAAHLDGPGTASVVELDLADLDQVASCAKRLLDTTGSLSALICNAGVMGGPLLRSRQGFELQMATNHLGHAALISAMWPLLHASGSRVVLLTSNEGRRGRLTAEMTQQDLFDPDPYDGKQVYRNSKQANLLFAQELHRRCARTGSPVTAVAAHPGAVSTNLFARQLDRAGRPRLARASKMLSSFILPSPVAGTRTTLVALEDATPSGAFVAPRGFLQIRGKPALSDVYASGRDPATAARLWEIRSRSSASPSRSEGRRLGLAAGLVANGREPLDRDEVLRSAGGTLHPDEVFDRRHADRETLDGLVRRRGVEIDEAARSGRRPEAVERTDARREREVIAVAQRPRIEHERHVVRRPSESRVERPERVGQAFEVPVVTCVADVDVPGDHRRAAERRGEPADEDEPDLVVREDAQRPQRIERRTAAHRDDRSKTRVPSHCRTTCRARSPARGRASDG